jgi:hypothetical protein
MAELKSLVKNTGPGDLLLIHFAGHGVLENERAYLVPADARKAALKDTALDLEKIKRTLVKANAQARILFLDACHSGIGRDGAGMDTEFERQIHFEANGVAVLASCRHGEVAWEHNKNRHGAFTYFLLEGLRGAAMEEGSYIVSFDSLKDYVTLSVKKWAIENGKQQWPNAATQLVGDPPIIEFRSGDAKPRNIPGRLLRLPLGNRGPNSPSEKSGIPMTIMLATLLILTISLIIVLVVNDGGFDLVDTPTITPEVTVATTVENSDITYAPPLGTIDFSDTFDDSQPDLSWATGAGGSYETVDGKLRVQALPWDNRSRNWKTHVVGGPDPRNAYICKECSIQTHMRFPRLGETSDEPRGGGIVFGYNDSKDFYQFTITGGDGKFTTWSIYRGPAEDNAPLTTVLTPTILTGSWANSGTILTGPWADSGASSSSYDASGNGHLTGKVTLRVDLHMKSEGNERYGIAYCFVNGEKVGIVRLSDYIGGQVGLVTAGSSEKGGTMIFDDFVVAMLSTRETPGD